MNLGILDWGIVLVFVLALIGITLYCRKFVRGVADFLAAGRMADRYLLTVSQGLGGSISIIALWEMIYAAGLPTRWWTMMSLPVTLVLALTGFIAYRFRQTRALTLAQFFEMRYSRRFRFFAGLLSWISGIFNYGIFPAITARFFIYFLGLPEKFNAGPFLLPSLPVVMALYLGLALFTALSGGQISIMLTDFFQGMLTLILFMVVMAFFLHKFAWEDVVAGLRIAPTGRSMINPFDTGHENDFNVGFFLIGIFSQIYNVRSWQGGSGFNSAARTPHEAQMAGILAQWRGTAQQMCLLLIPLVAYSVLHLPKFAAVAAPIQSDLMAIHDASIREQMVVPLFLAHVLPVGLMGLFAAILLSAAVSCDNSYLHSWGSIFIQDVVLPLRETPISAKTHLLLLRLSIIGVALFGFTFSLIFPLRDYVYMYFALTGAIYLGGAGVVIIGGLYWKRGTTAAAWTALISGSVLAFGGMACQEFWSPWIDNFLRSLFPQNPWLITHAERFPVDGQVMYFIAMIVASALYVLISTLGPAQECDMDKLLHRGAYALPEDQLAGSVKTRWSWKELLGLSAEFTTGDRVLFWTTLGWSILWFLIFVTGVLIHSIWGTTDQRWSYFWWINLWFSFVLGAVVTVWLVWGGLRDAFRLFRGLLANPIPETEDDGRVNSGEK